MKRLTVLVLLAILVLFGALGFVPNADAFSIDWNFKKLAKSPEDVKVQEEATQNDPESDPVVDSAESNLAESATTDESAVCAVTEDESEIAEADILDDGAEDAPIPDQMPFDPNAIPYEDLTDAEMRDKILHDLTSLDSMSVGYTNAGALINGVPMPESDQWKIVNPCETWGTRETVDFIGASINKVNEEFPDSPKLFIGDISDKDGGRLNRHVSHQAGRDVDLSFYYGNGQGEWWAKGNSGNLDLPRTWALLRGFFTETDVELVLVDRSIQILLYNYAVSIGEKKQWLNEVFQYPNGPRYARIRHAGGHATHFHVRFYNRNAQELGRRAYNTLVANKMIRPPTYYIYHKVRKGQSLGLIARKYGTSVSAIKSANGLRSDMIRAGRSYKIPKRGGVKPAPSQVSVPPRNVPPMRKGMKKAVVRLAASKKDITKAEGKFENLPVKVNPIASDEPAAKTMEADKTSAPITMAKNEPTPAPVVKPKPPIKKTHTKKSVSKKKSGWVTYKVKSGDCLWTIAKRHNCSASDIKKWNGMKSAELKPGQVLSLYVKK